MFIKGAMFVHKICNKMRCYISDAAWCSSSQSISQSIQCIPSGICSSGQPT